MGLPDRAQYRKYSEEKGEDQNHLCYNEWLYPVDIKQYDKSRVGKCLTKSKISLRRLKVYSKLLQAANIDDHHLDNLSLLGVADNQLLGRVSNKIYTKLVRRQTISEFFEIKPRELVQEEKVIKFQAIKPLTSEERNCTVLKYDTNTFITDDRSSKDLNSIKDVNRQLVRVPSRIITPLYQIGFCHKSGPCIGEKPQKKLNSFQNEIYFSYSGSWKDGKMHGSGFYQFAAGHQYWGAFSNGMPHGKGTMVFPNKSRYDGYFVQGKFEGQGRFIYGNGSMYYGGWKNGRRQGNGRLMLPSGMVYEGDFYIGRFHGRGTFRSFSDWIYDGSFENGCISGSGALINKVTKERKVKATTKLDQSSGYRTLIDDHRREHFGNFRAAMSIENDRAKVSRGVLLQDWVKEIKVGILVRKYERDREAYAYAKRKRKEQMEALKKAKAEAAAALKMPDLEDMLL